ncbi:hypothetical protein JCM33374_g3919 [Metschnikowia sp. JCM 33374]|nr:hypothetical protein JCM33374_g3919 [Metschnikowia sp. JCM 33374]
MLSFVNSLFKTISDDSLDDVSIELQKKSNFNPRTITYGLFAYIQSKYTYSIPDEALHSASLLSNYDGIYFHWDDWVDLSPGHAYLKKVRNLHPDGECNSGLTEFSQVNPYFMESYSTKVNRGMVNLYCNKDIPKRILVATDEGYFEVPVSGKKRIGQGHFPSGITKRMLVDMVSATPELEAQNKRADTLKFIKYIPLKRSVDISPQDFIFDIDKEILSLKEVLATNGISQEDKDHLKFLEASNSMVDSADRFFKYPWIYSDVVAGRSHHTSFPFFKRFISSKERQSVIQHMVRAWFRFSEANGVNSWVNYGSLLGWAYNGVNLPWDTDVDIQIPIAQLDKLSRRFNSTIITENPRDGNAKYFFEVSPTYTRQGNGRNFIDARFIEINTGLYIDISVLAHTSDQSPKSLMASLSEEEKLRAIPVHCKNWNWHLLDEILPIRSTIFEGSPVYIPKNISSILSRKYGQDSFTSKLSFNGYHYDSQLSLWIPDKEDKRECKIDPNTVGVDSLSAACKSNWIKDEFKIIYEAAKYHKELDDNMDFSSANNFDEYPEVALTRKDSYDYFQDIIERKVSTSDWFSGKSS